MPSTMKHKHAQRLFRRLIQTVCLIGLFACQGGISDDGGTIPLVTGDDAPSSDDGGVVQPVDDTPPPDDGGVVQPVDDTPPPDDGGVVQPVDDTPPPDDGGTIPTETTVFNYKLTVTVSVSDPASDGGLAYNNLVVGAAPEATDEFDNAYDARAFLAGPVQAYFAHAGDSGYPDSQQLWHDIRAGGLPQEWAVEVLADPGRTVTLFWTAPVGEAGCGTYRVSLQGADGSLGQSDLCAAGSLTYEGDGQIRHFVVRVS